MTQNQQQMIKDVLQSTIVTCHGVTQPFNASLFNNKWELVAFLHPMSLVHGVVGKDKVEVASFFLSNLNAPMVIETLVEPKVTTVMQMEASAKQLHKAKLNGTNLASETKI